MCWSILLRTQHDNELLIATCSWRRYCDQAANVSEKDRGPCGPPVSSRYRGGLWPYRARAHSTLWPARHRVGPFINKWDSNWTWREVPRPLRRRNQSELGIDSKLDKWYFKSMGPKTTLYSDGQLIKPDSEYTLYLAVFCYISLNLEVSKPKVRLISLLRRKISYGNYGDIYINCKTTRNW